MVAKLAVVLVLCLAVAGVSSTRMLNGAPKTGGKYYLQVVSSDTVVQQGQQPKLVLQLGNIGDSDITNPAIECYYWDDQTAKAVQFMSMLVYWQKLIPGQNQNAEREYSTNALGTTHRYCIITGTTIVNGKPVDISTQSNTVTVTVVPQQG